VHSSAAGLLTTMAKLAVMGRFMLEAPSGPSTFAAPASVSMGGMDLDDSGGGGGGPGDGTAARAGCGYVILELPQAARGMDVSVQPAPLIAVCDWVDRLGNGVAAKPRCGLAHSIAFTPP
jgi:hypothetical protein